VSGDDEAGDERVRAPRRDHRHRAREAALQMLYQWEVGRTKIDEVLRTYWTIDRPDEAPLSAPLEAFATTLAAGTVAHLEEIDPLITAHAEHWRLSRMAIIDRLILRLAVFEFLHSPEIPRKVAINEALELARTFSSDEAVKFVNGMLDGIKRGLETDGEEARP
jgi:N utilization substance protein B